jgi:hypothetical protein
MATVQTADAPRAAVRCRHCRRVRPKYRRGLCWECYRIPAILRRMPPKSQRAGFRESLAPGYRQLPATPTAAWPGSEEKIKVMERRVARGEYLYHPLDFSLLERLYGWLSSL